MKISLKSSLSVLAIAALLVSAFPESAQAGLCITSIRTENTHASINGLDLMQVDEYGFYDVSDVTSIRCEDLRAWKNVTSVLSVSLQFASVAALCTGAGLPVSIGLGVATGGVMFADGIIDNIPCDDSESLEKIEKRVHQQVCEDLAQQGIYCDGGTTQKMKFNFVPPAQGLQKI